MYVLHMVDLLPLYYDSTCKDLDTISFSFFTAMICRISKNKHKIILLIRGGKKGISRIRGFVFEDIEVWKCTSKLIGKITFLVNPQKTHSWARESDVYILQAVL